MSARVHSSAVVGREVVLGDGVEVGPFCQLDGKVQIGAGSRLIGHVTILGETEIGAGCVFHPNCVIGDEPQDLEYTGGPRKVRIGNRCVFREGATVHRASEHGEITVLGDDILVMQNGHVAHDCRIGNHAIVAGGALLAGWVEVGERAIVSGNCVVHQYTRVGRLALMRGGSRASRDIPPFCIADGTHTVRGINLVGLRRAGFDRAKIAALRHGFAELFGKRQNIRLAIERLEQQMPLSAEVGELIAFIRAARHGVAFGPHQAAADDVTE
ncbi:MAG TPA: acyl-ACP--UDP-N-acetylglucosamine O-acyltransferase [Candidatus Binataceae bacterium]|nr:acyl-ACP--UDP-N-acetylglucosamine O-acyltransferase [Candidatus Binataceae bacterium]